MGYWSKNIPGAYVVNISEFNTAAANSFAEGMIDKDNGETYLYNRYDDTREDRVRHNIVGKMGEEAFRVFLKEQFNIDIEVDYEQWKGSKNVDKNDCFINGLNIDVKFSCDNQNRGLENCYKFLNFMVPKTQTVKDSTVWGFCDKTMTNFVIMSWVTKEYYMKHYKTAYWQGVENYKLPLRMGRKVNELNSILVA